MPEQRDQQTTEQPESEPAPSPDVAAPFAPHDDDDTPLGDSDQHSDA